MNAGGQDVHFEGLSHGLGPFQRGAASTGRDPVDLAPRHQEISGEGVGDGLLIHIVAQDAHAVGAIRQMRNLVE